MGSCSCAYTLCVQGVMVKDVIDLPGRTLVVVDENGREKYYVVTEEESAALQELVGDVIARPDHWTLLSDDWIPND